MPEWVKFYHERWRNSERVQTVTAEERGVYFTLLLMQPILGSLPDDPCLPARMTGLAEEELARAFTRGGKACARKFEVSVKKREPILPDASASRARRASDASNSQSLSYFLSQSEKLYIADQDTGGAAGGAAPTDGSADGPDAGAAEPARNGGECPGTGVEQKPPAAKRRLRPLPPSA